MSLLVEVVSLGGFAHAALASGPARVIAVFERSGYVETPAGLACFGSVGNGPLNAITRMFPSTIAVGNALRFDLARTSSWKPRAAPKWNARATKRALEDVRVAARGRLPVEGFGFLLGAAPDTPAPVASFIRWLGDPIGGPGVEGLIGLGPGLTPAGDDLIGGALCALHAAGRSEIAVRLAGWALPLARTDTNRISQAHLACAAQGECGEAVNEAIVALLVGDTPDLERIDAIGHTSGWDALAGVILALSILVES